MSSMRAALKQLSSESLVYGLGQVSGRAVQLLLVPVLTRVLAQAEYGVSDLVFAYLQTAVLVLVFGLDGALARFFYQEPDRAARVRMASSSLVFRLAAGGAAALLLALFAGPLSGALVGSDAYRKYILIGAATLPCTLVVLFGNDVLRVTFQPWKFIALNLVQTVLTAGITLWLVLAKDLGVAGVLYGRLGGDAASALVALVLVRRTLAPRFSRATLRRMLAYGAPLVPAAIAYGAITSVDRYVLQRARGLEDGATVLEVVLDGSADLVGGLSAVRLVGRRLDDAELAASWAECTSPPAAVPLAWRMQLLIDGVVFAERVIPEAEQRRWTDWAIPVRRYTGAHDVAFRLALGPA
jgi:O-antigen/teichoic acid export membrane protein